MYVATSNGLVQFDLVSAALPFKTTATFATSRTTVSSLAIIGSTLFVADGDSSIETFSIANGASPLPGGSIAAPAAVTAVRANNGQLYASAGALSTFAFSSGGGAFSHVGTGAFGMSTIAPVTGDVMYLAGNDRRLRAVDFTVIGAPLEVLRDDLAPTAGTVNRISALATAGNRLYIAGGDMGLLTYDTTSFTAPFPVKGYAAGSTSSIVSLGDKIYVGRDAGGIREFTQSSSGSLTERRSWDTTRQNVVWDGANNLILTSSSAGTTMWSVQNTTGTPTAVATATFRSAPVSAVLVGAMGYAVLADRTLWSADFSQVNPAPRQITIASFSPSAIARSGNAVVVADVHDDGTTALAYFATADFTQTPKTASVPGFAVTGVTLDGSVGAVLTFQGVTLVDFNASSQATLTGSSVLARAVQFSGGNVYVLTDSKLLVWNAATRAQTKQFTIPGDAVAVSVAAGSQIADVATSSGVVSVVTNATTRPPAAIETTNPNVYYRRVITSADRIHLFDGSKVSIYLNSLRQVGTLTGSFADVAADNNGIYTVSQGLVATSHTPDGVARGSLTISEGLDAHPISIRAVGSAVWLSIERGCSTFACEKKTIVLDPRSGMVQTSTMTGSIIDVVVSGTRAYAITDSPSEIRVLNIADPFHPLPLVSAPSGTAPLSIAYANSTVYVLGDKLTAYAESTLTSLGDILGSYVPDPTGAVSSVDQRVRIEGGCALVTGRSFSPQLFTITGPTTWTPSTSFGVPSAVRQVATQEGVLQLLTDHSLETWAISPVLKPVRKLGR
jgi:hypothetical protein